MAKPQESVHIQIGDLGLIRENGRSINSAPRINQISPAQVADATPVPANQNPPKLKTITSTIFNLLFLLHLLSLSILISFLSLRGFLSRTPSFRPLPFFIPLLSSISLSAFIALLYLLFTLTHPSKSLTTSLWLSPLLTCIAAALLLSYGTGASFAVGVPALILGVGMGFYACWISPSVEYARRILCGSVCEVKFCVEVGKFVAVAVLVAVGYCWLWALGVGALAAAEDKRFDALFLLLLLLSLAWTMQVIRNLVHVAISRIAAFTNLSQHPQISARDAFHGAYKRSLGDVCIASALLPIVTSIRAMARAIDHLAGDTDEFMFSCSSCYLTIADHLTSSTNRYGFVHVGAHGKGFAESSADARRMFVRRGMSRLIDSDVTDAFCFFVGLAGGSLVAIVCGAWMLVADEGYGSGAMIYALIVGYFMVRIGMAWPQACVSACYVAYAENRRGGGLGSAIDERIRELEPSLN